MLGILPALAFGVPWDQNRARPPGFQRTLAYLENDLYDYPQAELQSIRNKILHDDLMTTIIPQLKAWGEPPSRWAELVQLQLDQMRSTQYEALKTIIRQTMNNPEGIIQAVEGNQPIDGVLLAHPNVIGLIALKWQMLNIAEQTYQSLIYSGLNPSVGSGGLHNSVPNVTPRKPAKSQNRIDWERMRETRRKAIERRRALEARWAEEARRRNAEIDELIRYLRSYGSLSNNKFKSTRPGAGSGAYVSDPAPAAPEPVTTEPAGEPAPTIEEIEQLEEEIEQFAEKIEKEESTKVEKAKVKVYRGTLILRRPSGLDEPSWQKVKDAIIAAHAQAPELSDMADKGDEVTWRYKTLTLPQSSALIEVVPDGEPTEEEVDGEPSPKKEEEEPKFVGNGDADTREVDVPGSGPDPEAAKPANPVAKAKPVPKPEVKPEPVVADTPGYWYDRTDEEAGDEDPIIYVRVEGVATRVRLSEAKIPLPEGYGVPANATRDTMTWYNERTGKIEPGKNRGTHKGPNQPASTNKFSKPRN